MSTYMSTEIAQVEYLVTRSDDEEEGVQNTLVLRMENGEYVTIPFFSASGFLPEDFVGKSIVPTEAVNGTGVVFKTASEWAVAVDNSLTLIELNVKNLDATPAGSEFSAIRITTDSAALDTASGLNIRNKGHSDNIYLAVEGKSGVASAPTGIGIDINRQFGSSGIVENSPANRGKGFFAWDWSTTDQGINGPTTASLRKHGNPASEHKLLELYADRRAIHIESPEIVPDYSTDQPLIQVVDAGAVNAKWTLTAGGDVRYRNQRGNYFDMLSGNDGYLVSVSSELQLRGGIDGLVFVENGGSEVWRINGAGDIRAVQTKGIYFDMPGVGPDAFVRGTAGEELQIGASLGGVKFITSGGGYGWAVHANGYPWWTEGYLVQTTVGAAGGASALPATPTKYLKVVDNSGAILVIPAYAA